MKHRHKAQKKAGGGMAKEFDEVVKETKPGAEDHKRGGKTKKHGGMARGGKSHKRMDKRARGGGIKLATGGSALSASSSKNPLTMASKVTSASR